VFLSTWHTVPEIVSDGIDWETLMALRAEVARELERLRVSGAIGAPLDAQLDVWCVPQQSARLGALGEELRFFMITSEARVHMVAAEQVPADAVAADSVPGAGVWIRVQPCAQSKCVRCWQHRPDVGASAEHPPLCGRCIGNLSMPGETREHC
jgi:isoleucyl-tRNA synthetase